MRKFIAAAVIVLLLTACASLEARPDREWTEPVRYELVEIEGMPCILYAAPRRLGLTCDWSQYDG